MALAISIIVAALLVWALAAELKRDIMMLQQNSYRRERYMHWLSQSKDTTSMWRLAALVVFFISLSTLASHNAAYFLAGIFSIAYLCAHLGKKYKKPLVWTARARRIYTVSTVLCIAVMAAGVLLFGCHSLLSSIYPAAAAALACLCASHMLVVTAVWLLGPVERAINRRYYNDAADILHQMPGLKVVGITGSYGKTSTKHYLHRILSQKYDTLMTPGSYNTTLGVVRTIRELLKPYTEVFIVEMGAKNPGDIREICQLVHPHMGIITAVGPQHLESFKTIDNVCRTKFELADALGADGLVLVNDDFDSAAGRQVTNCRCERYGIHAASALWQATDIKYTAGGTDFTVTGPGDYRLQLHTRLLGEANISDLLAAVACAKALDVDDKQIAAAVASIEPVEHRLSVKRTPGGITILDDAFNSNPVGSAMALQVLGSFDTGKRIVVTPGMIELGPEQYELNMKLGQAIAANADIAIIVGQYNRDALVQGINDGNKFDPKSLYTAESFAKAQEILAGILAPGDIILYENDLPDTFK